MIKRPNIPEMEEFGVNEVSGQVCIPHEDFKEEGIKNYYGLALRTRRVSLMSC